MAQTPCASEWPSKTTPQRTTVANAWSVPLGPHRRDLQRKLFHLTEKLEQAFIIGEVSDDERADLSASITDVTRRLAHPDQTLAASKDAGTIERDIEPRFAEGHPEAEVATGPLPATRQRA